MATSGQTIVKVTDYNNLIFSWSQVSQSIENNTTTINWELKLTADSSGTINSTAEKTWTVNLDGISHHGTNTVGISANSTKVLASGTRTIAHGVDGTKTFSYSFSQVFGITFSGVYINSKLGSGSGTLNPIYSGAKISVAPNFNDEESPRLQYINSAGSAVTSLQACISLTGAAAEVPYRDIPIVDHGGYTFNFTDAERDILRKAVTAGTTRTVYYYIKTTIGSRVIYDSVPRTFTIINGNPSIAPTVVDSNSVTLALTGNNTKMVKGYSNATYSIGATVKKAATIKSQYCRNGEETRTAATGTINKVTNGVFNFSVVDSRNMSASAGISRTLINYVPLTAAIQSSNLTTTGALSVTIAGNYFNGSFGAVSNSMEISYVLKENGAAGKTTSLGAVTPTIPTTNQYSYSIALNNLNYSSSYEIIITIKDKLETKTVSKVITSTPLFDWGKTNFKHHTNLYLDNNKTLRSNFTDGSDVQLLGLNSSNNLVIGWGGYDTGGGDTNIYGNDIQLIAKEKVYINGREYGSQQILWQGASHMNGTQSVNLSQAISAQPNGVILVFSLYRNNAAENVSINSFFISKKQVELLPGAPQFFLMGINAGLSVIGSKYIYIYDTYLQGHADNTLSSANSGITFNNGSYVLRYVIGV